LIARTEGVFVEPASAVCLAGLIHCVKAGKIPKGSVIAATMTGHGLKDPDNAMATAGFEPIVVPAEKEAVMKVMGL
jgi:threonine synthase